MKKKILTTLVLITVMVSSMVVVSPNVSATYLCVDGSREGRLVDNEDQCYDDDYDGSGDADLMDTLMNIINIIVGIAGFITVLMIIIGGIMYATSSGDAGKAKKAKDTIMYSLIGLVVAILAFAIVNFVLANIV